MPKIPTPKKLLPVALLLTLLQACTGTPEGMQAVNGFDKEQYLGTWYEIARLDHSFEEGLSQVSAQYTVREDGGIDVLNRGYSIEEQKWSEAQGKAYFVGDDSTGHLKVSFFGPFYASYVIFDLDKTAYQYAFVTGYNKKYLWLLARTPSVSKTLKEKFLTAVKQYNFDSDKLIWVEHE